MLRRLAIAFLALALYSATEVSGENSTASKGIWTIDNIEPYTYWLDGIVPSGASVDILFNGLRLFHGLDTILETDIGGGWQTNYFYRNPDGSPYTGPGETPSSFDQAEFLDDFGIRQGLLRDEERDRNLLEVFLFYRLHYDRNFPTTGGEGSLLYASAFPDRQEILANALHAGLAFDTVSVDVIHKTHSGVYAEASAEWGPRSLFNGIGGADYYRLNATLKGFLPLFALSESAGTRNLLSMYAASYFCADYAGGESVPIFVFESYGGRYPRWSNSPTIYGLEEGLYGADLKILENLELRILGPALGSRDIVPGLFAFLDSAYYDGYFMDPTDSPGGYLASGGGGILLDFFNFADLNAYFAYPILGKRVDGRAYAIGFGFSMAF
jgi:hypothetical protein